jgi:hypothetical protein
MIVTLLSMLAVALGLVGVAVLVRKSVVLIRGEAELVRRLAGDESYRTYIRQLEQAHSDPELGGELTPEEIAEVRRRIARQLDELNAKQREEVAQALNQPTVRGRENYVRKLLSFSLQELQHQP